MWLTWLCGDAPGGNEEGGGGKGRASRVGVWGGGWRRVRTRRHRRRMIKKYANPHIVYFNSIIILELDVEV